MDWKLIELAPEPRGSPRYQTAFPERLRRALRLPRLRLRSRRMFGGSSPYIMAVCLDFFLRFAWTTTLMPSERMLRQMPSFFPLISPFTAAGEVRVASARPPTGLAGSPARSLHQAVTCTSSSAEIWRRADGRLNSPHRLPPFPGPAQVLRRGMWSVLRVESEHLSTEGFRRVQAVPLDFDDTYASRRETKEVSPTDWRALCTRAATRPSLPFGAWAGCSAALLADSTARLPPPHDLIRTPCSSLLICTGVR